MNLSLSYGTFSGTDHTTQVSIGYIGYTDKGGASTVLTAHQALCFIGINLLASYNPSTGEGAAVTPTFTDEGAILEKLTDLLKFESRSVQVSVPFFRCALLQKENQ